MFPWPVANRVFTTLSWSQEIPGWWAPLTTSISGKCSFSTQPIRKKTRQNLSRRGNGGTLKMLFNSPKSPLKGDIPNTTHYIWWLWSDFTLLWLVFLDLHKMLGKHFKHIIPNGGEWWCMMVMNPIWSQSFKKTLKKTNPRYWYPVVYQVGI